MVSVVKTRVTLKEVATNAGVSYQTVSKVLNKQAQVSKETEERIWAAVRGLGYRPNFTARSLRSQRSYTLAYSWAPAPMNQANPILDQFLQSMLVAAEEMGYYLLSFPYHAELENRLAAYEELIDTGRVDGFVLSSVEYNDPRIHTLQKKNFPFVCFGQSNSESAFPWIDVDGGRGIELATEHLIELGHRRIAALGWAQSSRVGNHRVSGYFRALSAAGIRPEEAWLLRGEGRVAFGYRAANQLLDLPAALRPTALVALNDSMAVGALWAVKERGLVAGRDIAITGFDNAPMAQYLDPPLTSVSQPVWEVGQRIIPLLVAWIDSGVLPDPMQIMLEPALIVRESSTGQKTPIG